VEKAFFLGEKNLLSISTVVYAQKYAKSMYRFMQAENLISTYSTNEFKVFQTLKQVIFDDV